MTHDRAVAAILGFEDIATRVSDLFLEAEIKLRKAQEQGIFTEEGSIPSFVRVDAATGCVEQTNVPFTVFHEGGQAAYAIAQFMAAQALSPGGTLIRAAVEKLARP